MSKWLNPILFPKSKFRWCPKCGHLQRLVWLYSMERERWIKVYVHYDRYDGEQCRKEV